jgi:drug/metabolite transporter (DMT)-like permease
MILGYFFGRKTYTLQKVFMVVFVVIGILLFTYKDTNEKLEGENLLVGNSILAFSLFMDGCAGATEDRMRSVKKPTTLNLMFFVNVWSVLIGIVGVVTFNEAPRCIKFVTKHPEILQFCGLSMLTIISGQFFRNAMVR